MNPLDYITTTNYPTSFLQNTFGNKYYQSVVEPAKAAIQSGAKVTKPALGQLIKNWNPLKAVFTPQMLKTGPTLAAKTFLKGSGIGTLASLFFSPTHLGADDMPTGDIDQEYFDYYSKYGDNYGDLKIPGWNKKMIQNKKNQLMNRRKQDMQQKIRQAEAVQQVQQNIQTYGTGDRPNEGMNTPGGGKGQSPTGGDVAGTPFVRGGRASYFDGGLLSLWPR